MRAILLLVLGAAALDAQNWHRGGNTLFKLPPGWTRVDRNGSSILRAPELRGLPTASIVLSPSARIDKLDLKTAFEHVLKKSNADIKIIGGGRIEQRQSSEGYEVLVNDVNGLDGRTQFHYRFFMASRPGDRFELLTFAAPNEILYQKYLPVLEEFCSTMTYVNIRKPQP